MFFRAFIFLSLGLFFFSTQAEELETINIYGDQNFVNDEFTTLQDNNLKELQQKPSSELNDVFNQFQNVSVNGGPRADSSDINIRGFDSKRIVFILDGARQNLRSTHTGGLLIEPLFLEEVKVYSGASSVDFGGGSIGGTISLKTLSPDSLLRGDTLGGHIVGISESANNLLGAGAFDYGNIGNWSYLRGATFRSTSNSKLSDGTTLPYSAYDQHAHLVKLIYNNNGYKLTTGFENYNQDSISRSTPTIESDFDELVKDDRYRRSANISLQKKSKQASSEINLSHSVSKITKDKSYSTGDGSEDIDERSTASTGIDIKRKYNTKTGSFSFGANYLLDNSIGKRNGDKDFPFFPSGKLNTAGAYITSKYTKPSNYDFLAGLRYDYFKLTADKNLVSKSQDSFNLHAGVVYNWSDRINSSIIYSESFNAPRVQEVFPNDIHFPGNNFIPNTSLQPEISSAWELKNNFVFDNILMVDDFLEISSNMFFQTVDDYIDQEITPSTTSFINAGKVKTRGHESRLKYSTGPMNYIVSANTVRANNITTGDPLISAPADEVTFKVNYKASNMYFGIYNKRVDSQDRINLSALLDITKLPTDSYELWGLEAGYSFKGLGAKKVLVNLNIDNLFDIEYKPHGDAIPAKKQNIFVNISAYF